MATGDLIKLGTLYSNKVKIPSPTRPWPMTMSVSGEYGNIPAYRNFEYVTIGNTDSDDAYKMSWREVHVGGKVLLISDRVVMTNVNHPTLNGGFFENGKIITIDGQLYRQIMITGGDQERVPGNSTSGGNPMNNLWDRIISNEDNIVGLPKPSSADLVKYTSSSHPVSTHDEFWNWSRVYSFVAETVPNSGGARVCIRGNYSVSTFASQPHTVASEYTGWRPVLEMLNAPPNVTLSSPSNNNTLYENDTLSIGGTTSDADNGNTVTIRYQVNAETVRSIKAFVSDGTTVESFAKSLVFKSGKLYDGETTITGNLTDGVAHKLKVWATDDQGGQSTIIERTFYVVPNRAPSLTVEPPVIDGNIDRDKFTINGSYNDADGNTTTVKYRINGGNSVQVASGTSGVFDFEVSFAQLTPGPNTIVVEAIDSYGAKTSKTVKLNKNVVSTEQLRSTARYKILPPTNKAQAVLLWIERDKDLAIDVAISMTMAGEAEAFVPVTVSESVPIANGSTTYEDTFFYEAATAKENIIVQIDMTRLSVDANDKITLISGVLE